MDALLLVAAASVAGAAAPFAPAPVAVVLASVVVAARFAPPIAPRVVLFAALVAVACGARSAARVRAFERSFAAATEVVPRPSRCAIVGEVVSMPVHRGVLRADVEVRAMRCEGARSDASLLVRVHDLPEATARGDVVEGVVQLAPARRTFVEDLGDPRPSLARRAYVLSGSAVAVHVVTKGRGARAVVDRARHALRRGIVRTVRDDVAPVARALVLGEEDLAEPDDEAFKRSGLTHLLAVSGSHVAFVVGGFVIVVRALLLRVEPLARRIEVGRVAAALSVPFAAFYEQLAGDSGSARRATVMAMVVLVARASGRAPDTLRALASSILAVLAVDPLAPFDLSFALSLAATIGLLSIAPPVRSSLRALPSLLRSPIAATVAASIACAPLVALLSGAVPVLGLVANLVAVPIGELAALPLCNAAALMGALFERGPLGTFASFIGTASAGALSLLRGVAQVAAAPSIAVLRVPPPTPMQLGVLFGLAAALAVAPKLRARWFVPSCAAAAILVLLELAHLRFSQPRGVLRLTVLDVGQGDATLVDFPDGSALLVDGGGEPGSPWDPGRAVVQPFLDARRRRALAAMVLSHPHPDHFLGLRHPLATVRVHELWDTGEASVPHGELATVFAIARARGVRVVRPSTLCGSPRAFGGAHVEVLAPCPAHHPDRSTNDNSFVLRVAFGEHAALLVGDAEHEAESELVARYGARLSADFLKVGHHGSRTSSTAPFLAAVSPRVATISCGARNRFGHPHPIALARLAASGARVLRTDLVGSIRFTTDGVRFEVATAREQW